MWLLSVEAWLVQQLDVALVCNLFSSCGSTFIPSFKLQKPGGDNFGDPSSLTITLCSDFVSASSPLSKDLRVAIVDSAKSMAVPKFDAKAIPDQRVSAITPATVRFLKGFLSFTYSRFMVALVRASRSLYR